MFQLDGGLLEIEAQVGFLPGREDAVDDAGDAAVVEIHEGGGDILDLDGAVERARDGAELAPTAEQKEELVHRVDAVADGGAAEFVGPLAAPRDLVVGGVAKPERVADGDERATERVRSDGGADVSHGGAVAHLENGGAETAGAFFGGLNQVEFGERGAEGFFAEHVRAGLHRGDGERRVKIRRRADMHEIGPSLGEKLRGVGEDAGDAVLGRERGGAGEVDVEDGDEVGAVGMGAEAADVLAGDIAGADEGGAESGHGKNRDERTGGNQTGRHADGQWREEEKFRTEPGPGNRGPGQPRN